MLLLGKPLFSREAGVFLCPRFHINNFQLSGMCIACMFIAHTHRGKTVNQTLLNFEQHTRLGPTYAAELLGMAYPTYAQVRNGRRELQKYTTRHIEAVMALPTETLERLKTEHLRNGWRKNETAALELD